MKLLTKAILKTLPKTETEKLQRHKLTYLNDRVEDLLDSRRTVNRDD